MAITAEEFAQSAIDKVHALWLRSRDKYPNGYGVFYGPAHLKPALMVIGLNPGGDATCFSGKKESIVSAQSPMEYIYRDDRSYRLARKTAALFEAIGFLDTLRCSLKTNLNFFRSKKFADLPQSHTSECLQLVMEMITFFKPQVILCESMRVFDILQAKLTTKNSSLMPRIDERDKRGRRIYSSVSIVPSDDCAVLIGIKHLTGSRPSSVDIEKIQRLLANDLRQTISSS